MMEATQKKAICKWLRDTYAPEFAALYNNPEVTERLLRTEEEGRQYETLAETESDSTRQAQLKGLALERYLQLTALNARQSRGIFLSVIGNLVRQLGDTEPDFPEDFWEYLARLLALETK